MSTPDPDDRTATGPDLLPDQVAPAVQRPPAASSAGEPLSAGPGTPPPLPVPPTAAAQLSAETSSAGSAAVPARPRSRRRRVAIVLLSLGLVAALALAGYLFSVATQWQERSEELTAISTELGTDLAATRARLEGTQAELDAVRSQLANAQERIIQLADEKAQLGDDREVQRQLADYQARVSAAAGTVASALDECIQGQQMLIGYLEDRERYDEEDLERFRSDVDRLCQSATDANLALQRELSQ